MLDNAGSGTINVSDIDNGTYDNCGPVTLSVTPTSFSCTNQGIRNVTFSATDLLGILQPQSFRSESFPL